MHRKNRDFPLRGRRLFLSRLIGGGFHRGGAGAAGVPAWSGRRFSPFIMYSYCICKKS